MAGLAGRTAFVTGGGRGIGRAIAMALGRCGCTVIGTATTEEGAGAISTALGEAAIAGRGVALDVGERMARPPSWRDAGQGQIHPLGRQLVGQGRRVHPLGRLVELRFDLLTGGVEGLSDLRALLGRDLPQLLHGSLDGRLLAGVDPTHLIEGLGITGGRQILTEGSKQGLGVGAGHRDLVGRPA